MALNSWFTRFRTQMADRYDDWQDDVSDNSSWRRWLLVIVVVYLVLVLILGMYWSSEPDRIPLENNNQATITGVSTTTALINVATCCLAVSTLSDADLLIG